MRERRPETIDGGLCVKCRHARRLESAKGSSFLQCGRAKSDPRYRQYPELPVRDCRGFQPASRG